MHGHDDARARGHHRRRVDARLRRFRSGGSAVVAVLVTRWLDQIAALGDDGLLHGLGQVVPQMPAVSNLYRGRRARAGTVGIGAGPVPAHNAYPRMLFEPILESV